MKSTISRRAGPLLGLRTGTSIDGRGALIQPGTTFAHDAPHVVAVVQVRELTAPGTLDVEWRRVRGRAAEPLFTQRSPVRSFDRAYATADSPGTLSSGWYEVKATLAGQSEKTYWRVAPRRDATRSGPLTAGRAGVVARSSAPAVASAASPSGPCWPVFGPYGDFWIAVIQGSARIPGTGCPRLFVGASIKGRPQLVARTEEQSVTFEFDPCDLEGGSDMPGTIVHLYGCVAGRDDCKMEDVELIDPNVEGPGVLFVSAPAPGSTVAPGDRIPLDASAFEFPATPGIRSLEITSPEGSVGRMEKAFMPCKLERMALGYLSRIYVVPENPPPVIELRATATDYADRSHTEILRYATARKGYEFKTVRFDYRDQDRHFYSDISGHVCGGPLNDPWTVSTTVTNWIDPSNTGTFESTVRIPAANVEAAGSGSPTAELLRLAVMPGPEPRIRVVALLGNGVRKEATVPLLKTRACGTDAGAFEPMTGWQADAER